MLYILEDTINGILMGSIYGLTALGLTLIFGVLKVINFAHGSLLMVGMYAAYWAVTPDRAAPVPDAGHRGAGHVSVRLLLQDIVIKPIFKAEKDVREPITVIIVTTGLWYILDNLTLLIFGPQYRTIPDNPLRGKMLEIGDMMISVPKLWGFVHRHRHGRWWSTCFLQKTRMGRAIRATSLDRDAASLHGHQPVQDLQRRLRHRHGRGRGRRGDAGAVLQRLSDRRRALRHQVLHHRGAGRAREHRRRPARAG